MKIIEEAKPQSIPVNNLKDGDIAVIVKWDNLDHYVDRIIQRYKNILITLGANSGKGFTALLGSNSVDFSKYLVRILPPGTKLEI